MIRTVADLLSAVRAKEVLAIESFGDVGHPVMIGDMYEGLTKSLLERAIFEGLDVRVVDGKIRGRNEVLTSQIDCMVVVGEGRNLPFTDHYIYDLEQVIAVVEVKKSLYGAQLRSAYENLRSVSDAADERLLPRRTVTKPFRTITGVDVLSDEHLDALPRWQRAIFQNVVSGVLVPARIALGFYGFATEHSLRGGLIDYLSEQLPSDPTSPVAGFGPTSLPDLIISGNNAIVKLIGMPYAARVSDNAWPVLGSIRSNASLALLEVLWYRLSTRFGLSSSMFGEDLELEQINPLISATFHEDESGRAGWQYEMIDFSAEELDAAESFVPWQPFVLDKLQFAMVGYLCRHELLELKSAAADAIAAVFNVQPDVLISRSLASGLVFLDASGALRLNTDACLCAVDPVLGFVAADNHDGRFARWLAKRPAARETTESEQRGA